MNWQKAYIGMIIIAIGALAFALTVSKSSPLISAVYARIAGIEEEEPVPSVPPPVGVSGPLRHKDVSVSCLSSRIKNADDCLMNNAFPRELELFRETKYNNVSVEDSAEPLQPFAIINAVASSTPGFAALEKMPPKPAPKSDKYEISPEEILIPREKSAIRSEYTILVEEQ